MRIRGERWRVIAESPFEAASIVDVDGGDASNRGVTARFVLPFEPLEHLPGSAAHPCVVSLARWRHVACAGLAAAVPRWTSLRAAAHADLAVIPFQLEPALAVTRGDGCRLLIADDVGLGKTIEAGLIVAETVTRTPDARVLIVSPAGLRDQWREELESRFSLHTEVLDAAGVARTGARLAPDVNPWAVHPIVITSIDYVKRPDVMRSLEALLWDVIVFDEAHTLAGRSDRGAAAAALAGRSRCVVMLSATPHSGDEDAFTRLCAVGDLGASFPLITFRRTRAGVGLPHDRRSCLLRVRPTAAEAVMHRKLREYTELITQQAADSASAPAAALVATMLMRRACSSAASLWRSLQRRLTLLAGDAISERDQLALPFVSAEDDEEPGAELGVAGLGNAAEERRWLEHLLSLSKEASLRESKLLAIRRYLVRANEPALVFTEYRDTLQHLATSLARFEPLQLHGGLTSSERRRALREFTEGASRLLLATDAASEGLNLHHRCRLVVSLELPWTPVRLEQRIGRVDRLGQSRRVHAVQLVVADTAEESVVSRFVQRTERIRVALDGSGIAHDRDVSLRQEAALDATRLQSARALHGSRDVTPYAGQSVLAIAKRRGASRGRVWAVRLPCVDAADHLVFETVIGLHDVRPTGDVRSARDVRAVLALDDALEGLAAESHRQLLTTLSTSLRASLLLMTRREQAIADALRLRHARLSAGLLQPGLFDRRAERAASAQASVVDQALGRSMARLMLLERLAHLREDTRAIAFGIAFR